MGGITNFVSDIAGGIGDALSAVGDTMTSAVTTPENWLTMGFDSSGAISDVASDGSLSPGNQIIGNAVLSTIGGYGNVGGITDVTGGSTGLSGFYSDPLGGATSSSLGSGTYGLDSLTNLIGGDTSTLGSGYSGIYGAGTGGIGSLLGTSDVSSLNYINLLKNLMNSSGQQTNTTGTGTTSNMSNLGSALGLASGIASIIQGNQMAKAADPFSASRAQYATQLNNLMSNPSSVTTTPGYQFLQQQGLEGVSRQMAARGYNTSGNELLALQNQGQSLANSQYQQQLSNLMQLSGASQTPAQGTTAASNILNTTGQNGWNAVGQGLGTLSSNIGAIKNWWENP
jgi:hypothetical protein